MTRHNAGKLAADALAWAAKGGKPPGSIARLSTADQAKLAKAAAAVKSAARRKGGDR